MNAHPHSVPLLTEAEAPAHPEASRFAHNLIQAATAFVPLFEAGKPVDAAALRAVMEEAFGASDTSGAWVWKDAYEAAEVAQILMLSRYGGLMQRQAPLDVGLETLRAEKFVITDRKVIFEHEATGAAATALTVERTDRNDPLTLPRVKAICSDTKGATLCWNKTSKRAALMVKASAFMDEDGVPILRVKLLRPMATEILTLAEFSNSHWEEVDDRMFEQLWLAEVEAVPEFTTSTITLICGLLLPIWDRLPADNMRIYRLQTEGGERAIGRLVSQEQLLNVYVQLGLDCQIEMTPQEVFSAVMDAKTTLSLLGGFQLRRSLVMGQPRLELIGASGAALPSLKAMGCFTEVIQWKTRVFIPVDGTEVLARVLAERPVGASATDAAA